MLSDFHFLDFLRLSSHDFSLFTKPHANVTSVPLRDRFA